MIKFTRLSGHIGADVHGVDLSRPLSSNDVSAIQSGLLEHLVLFFREQKLLTVEQHKALASNFGELEATTYRREGVDDMIQLVEGGLTETPRLSAIPYFHSDSAFKVDRPLGAMLQAQIMPPSGGDTCFASMYAAYDTLSPAMQSFLEGLEGCSSLAHMAMRNSSSKPELRFSFDEHPPIKTPVIDRHPETGRKFLNVNPIYTSHIDGLNEGESDMLLRFLYEHVRRPEFEVRLHWNIGDVAFWDNWSTQHCGIHDYTGHRLLQRISILRRTSNRQKVMETAEAAVG